MDSRANMTSTNSNNYGDFAGVQQPTQQQQFSSMDRTIDQQSFPDNQTADSPHHHLHRENEPIGQKQYDPNAAAAFSQPNVDELSSNQTTSYRPDVDYDDDQQRSTTDAEAGMDRRDEQGEQRQAPGGVGTRITGKMQQMTGKLTKNPMQEAAGLEKQSAATKDASKADVLEQRADDVRARAAGGAHS